MQPLALLMPTEAGGQKILCVSLGGLFSHNWPIALLQPGIIWALAIRLSGSLNGPKEASEEGLLGVHLVFGLSPDAGLGAFHDFIGDFFSPVGRETVEDDRFPICPR